MKLTVSLYKCNKYYVLDIGTFLKKNFMEHI